MFVINQHAKDFGTIMQENNSKKLIPNVITGCNRIKEK